jgi:hypothetical protein
LNYLLFEYVYYSLSELRFFPRALDRQDIDYWMFQPSKYLISKELEQDGLWQDLTPKILDELVIVDHTIPSKRIYDDDYDSAQNSILRQENDEQSWEEKYKQLYQQYEALRQETLERDYEEFQAHDTNQDDKISLIEYQNYVRKYLSSFPELSEADFPTFHDLDLNHDGFTVFDEWLEHLQLQKVQKEQKAAKDDKNKVS